MSWSQEQATRVLRVWQRRLHLRHWEIEFNWRLDPEESSADAQIDTHDLYDAAEIRLAPGWAEWDDDKMNRTVAHELTHCLTRDVERTLEALKPSRPGVADHLIERDIEALVERVSRALVELGGAVAKE